MGAILQLEEVLWLAGAVIKLQGSSLLSDVFRLRASGAGEPGAGLPKGSEAAASTLDGGLFRASKRAGTLVTALLYSYVILTKEYSKKS